jgi:hypothetical protein
MRVEVDEQDWGEQSNDRSQEIGISGFRAVKQYNIDSISSRGRQSGNIQLCDHLGASRFPPSVRSDPAGTLR